jgi:hypothetical protein
MDGLIRSQFGTNMTNEVINCFAGRVQDAYYYIWRCLIGSFAQIANSTCYLCPVRPSVRILQRGSHETAFCELWYRKLVRESVEKLQISLKSDKNVGHFIRRPKFVYIVDNSADGTHFCLSMSKFNGCILFMATCRSTTVQKEGIFALPWQQWIGESAQQRFVIRKWPILFSAWLNQNYPKRKGTF